LLIEDGMRASGRRSESAFFNTKLLDLRFQRRAECRAWRQLLAAPPPSRDSSQIVSFGSVTLKEDAMSGTKNKVVAIAGASSGIGEATRYCLPNAAPLSYLVRAGWTG
jgi:hypothetical protein